MQNSEALRFLFIINPISGGKEKRDWETAIRDFFRESHHSMEFYLLNGESDVASIRHHVQQVKPDRVVGVGGDGTVKMIAEELAGSGIPLGIIPAGSANGMARELEIPLEVQAALEVTVNGRIRPIDAIRINGEQLCIHLSDIGLNALLVHHFEKSGKRGMWGYGKGVLRVLFQKQLMEVTMHMGPETARRKAYMVVLANARTYGTGAVINPDGDPSDGKFEVVVVRRLNLLELLKMLVTHRPFHPNRIEVFQTDRLELSTRKKANFQIDGEYLGRLKAIRAEVLPGCVHIMVPQAKEA
ncbi:MAG TPA: diacylglycerol kinase family protein [Chitinophagaceae bacterium]|jgi:YegS/Rv2252/BmrU family lipid kinase|nr:diacylglycerol kinase family protein [Chitinophagaceae bacterium]